MFKFLPFAHFYGLVIVLVLAMMLALPASAQTSSSSEAQSTGAILINIDKSRQKMTVFLDGVEKYVWPVSTGQAGYSTPSGTYTATSMNEIWYSKEWDNAPMPHSVFFRKDGYAIHGSYEVKNLGRPASHGCVRISPGNATTLYALVKKIGLKNTEVVLTGVTPGGEYKVARPEEPRYGQAGAGGNYYAQPQWGGGFFGRSFGGSFGRFGQRHHVVLQFSRRIVANPGHKADLVVDEDECGVFRCKWLVGAVWLKHDILLQKRKVSCPLMTQSGHYFGLLPFSPIALRLASS
jgi:hypothetical protein